MLSPTISRGTAAAEALQHQIRDAASIKLHRETRTAAMNEQRSQSAADGALQPSLRLCQQRKTVALRLFDCVQTV
eukprot:COSAG02_NODE_68363_length_249_cov_13.000000_1_plen_74_part_10